MNTHYSNYFTGIFLCAFNRTNTLNPHDNPYELAAVLYFTGITDALIG